LRDARSTRTERHQDFFGPAAIVSSLTPEGEADLLIGGRPEPHLSDLPPKPANPVPYLQARCVILPSSTARP
jgi:hypothetical protein